MNGVAALADRVRRDAAGRRGVVLIDGGSGAGKTSLADALAAELGRDWQLVSLDDAYPGWSGLAAASAAVHETMLRPDDPGYHSWDWVASRPGPWRPLDPRRPIIIEGCGAITPQSAHLASTSIWIALGAATRRRRALSRPTIGHDFADFWDMWEQQEHRQWRAHRPRALAHVVLAGGES